jgi:phosphoserine phosphatase
MRRRMIVMDVDSTFIREEQLDLLADEAGVGPHVEEITARMRRGEIEFAESLRQRTRALAGLEIEALDRARARITLTLGAPELLRFAQSRGWPVYLVTGGYHDLIDQLVADLPVTGVRANRLEIAGGRLTGNVLGEIIDREGKARQLRALAAEEGIPMGNTIAIGDGANDISMVQAAGVGVAFGASAALQEVADVILPGPGLDAVISALEE